jgi:hypothetical protein
MRHTHGEGVLVFALFAALTACADPVGRSIGPAASKDVITDPAPAAASAERVALSRIARLVAVAMDNEAARQRLKRDMRAAPFREHKLQLTSYLRSKDGRALLDGMSARTRGGASDVFAALDGIRPLELYMPVVRHRESWTGKGDILVVSQLDESAPIVAFDERGREVSLDRNVAPDQPTLSIVPVETRFDEPMGAAASRNARDLGGASIGTLERLTPKGSSLIACGDTCGGGGGSAPPAIPPGIYLEYSRILDMKEPWFRGDPEIEVHIQGPIDAANPRFGAQLSCAGEHAYDYRKVFDQNTAFWEGRVMLFSEEEASAFVAKFHEGFNIMFWEDDNVPCTTKTDVNETRESIQATGRGGVALATQLIKATSWYLTAAIFVASVLQNADWLLTNDDFLGIAVFQANLGYAFDNTTHVIMIGQQLNGRAQIVWRP